MKKIVIFDFNRTLFDPDNRILYPNTLCVLQILIKRGFDLYLVSRAQSSRGKLIVNLGLAGYFKSIVISDSKNIKDFKTIIDSAQPDKTQSFVVGDRIKQEIFFGNRLGLKTIWIKTGKFSVELPENKMEIPTYTVLSLNDVLSIFE